MKMAIIRDIRDTVDDFYNCIINPYQNPEWEQWLADTKQNADNVRVSGDDTCDVDYGRMVFYVHKTDDGMAELCRNASYYPQGFEDDYDEIMDIELFD
jgi:hypothetical protein